MRHKKLYLVLWLAAAVLLFFCFFGRTDALGFHSGGLFELVPAGSG